MEAEPGLKPFVKRTVKTLTGLVGRCLPAHGGSRILTYHSVGRRDHEMNVTPEAFAAQMAWLAENATVIPLDACLDGRPGVAITFDDGYRDNLTEAAPILAAHGFPATVFMVAGAAGGSLSHDADPAAGAIMTWDELRQLHAQGVAIGAHTMTHPRLARLDAAAQREEIVGSVRRIAEELGAPVTAFAYPYGTGRDYNALSMALVEESGCIAAVSNRYGVNAAPVERWAMRRIWIDRTDKLAMFRAKVTGRLDLLSALDAPAALRIRDWLNGRGPV